jgi:hypothetical protein
MSVALKLDIQTIAKRLTTNFKALLPSKFNKQEKRQLKIIMGNTKSNTSFKLILAAYKKDLSGVGNHCPQNSAMTKTASSRILRLILGNLKDLSMLLP